MTDATSPFAQTVTPVAHDLGNFEVRRAVPSARCRMVGPFVFVDEFGPARLDPGHGMDVRPHPHIGLATVTYLFDGAIDHRDSLGNHATIRPGAVNLMTAGRGIVHSERTPPAERVTGLDLFGMQTWLALPERLEETDPAFESVGAGDLPVIEDGGTRARVIMGSLWGRSAPTTCHAETIYADIALGAGGHIPLDADAEERAVMLVAGEASADGEPLALYALHVLQPGRAMTLASGSGARVMLLGGESMGPRRVWWNFVSSRMERIEQAKEDWQAGRFPLVPGDEKEFIPIPEKPQTVSYP
ncbi:pirin family protein [Croceicoccus sp. BE223]|uniref:pirin family protein n=1 Tax=Croceicoccus sp. BE223 TaxID=2817716 RepID=UPI002860C607|nr:pirin family protein [Croceicoccus sp. BE223]MDR7102757.1 redox-sensitive bicupin YhaK (pirin superfamily) [Croceicoccus sp. BE223]